MSSNPPKHIDPFGTILLPALLMITRSPFGSLRKARAEDFGRCAAAAQFGLIAAAGPGIESGARHLERRLVRSHPLAPPEAADWIGENLNDALIIDVLLRCRPPAHSTA